MNLNELQLQNKSQRMLFYGILGLMALLVLFAIIMFVVPLFQSKTTASVKVYASLPMELSTGQAIANGIRLAFEEHQYRTGDANVSLVVNDDGDETGAWNGDAEIKIANAAAADPSVVAYLGTFNSGAAKLGMPILNEAGILQISPGNTWPGLTKLGFLPGEPGIFYPSGVRHYFRVCTTDDLQGPAGALWAKELGFKKVFVVDDSDVYGTGIANLFADKARTIGLSVLGKTSIKKDDPTFDASIAALTTEIIKSGADLVYYGGITPNGGPELLRALRISGSKQAFMGPDGILEQDFVDRTGKEHAEGVYATTVGVPPEALNTSESKAFVAAYTKRFGKAPDVFSAFGYEAANVTLQAISRSGGTTRAAVLQQVRAMTSYSGVLGTWQFDENGDTSAKLLSGNEVENGAFTYLEKLPVP